MGLEESLPEGWLTSTPGKFGLDLAERSVPPHMDLSIGFPECPHPWQWAAPRVDNLRVKDGSCHVLMSSMRSHTPTFPQYPIDYKD